MKSLGKIEVMMGRHSHNALVLEDGTRGVKVTIVLNHNNVRYLTNLLQDWADERLAEATLTRGLFK